MGRRGVGPTRLKPRRRAAQVLDQPLQLSAWMTITGPDGRVARYCSYRSASESIGCVDRTAVVDDAGPAVHPHPPELVPVVVVVIGEERDPRVLPDVAEPLQLHRRLRLVVDRDVDQVVIDRERDRHQIRLPVGPGRRQPRHPCGGQPLPRFALPSVAPHDCRIRPRSVGITLELPRCLEGVLDHVGDRLGRGRRRPSCASRTGTGR